MIKILTSSPDMPCGRDICEWSCTLNGCSPGHQAANQKPGLWALDQSEARKVSLYLLLATTTTHYNYQETAVIKALHSPDSSLVHTSPPWASVSISDVVDTHAPPGDAEPGRASYFAVEWYKESNNGRVDLKIWLFAFCQGCQVYLQK